MKRTDERPIVHVYTTKHNIRKAKRLCYEDEGLLGRIRYKKFLGRLLDNAINDPELVKRSL